MVQRLGSRIVGFDGGGRPCASGALSPWFRRKGSRDRVQCLVSRVEGVQGLSTEFSEMRSTQPPWTKHSHNPSDSLGD